MHFTANQKLTVLLTKLFQFLCDVVSETRSRGVEIRFKDRTERVLMSGFLGRQIARR